MGHHLCPAVHHWEAYPHLVLLFVEPFLWTGPLGFLSFLIKGSCTHLYDNLGLPYQLTYQAGLTQTRKQLNVVFQSGLLINLSDSFVHCPHFSQGDQLGHWICLSFKSIRQLVVYSHAIHLCNGFPCPCFRVVWRVVLATTYTEVHHSTFADISIAGF